MENQHEFNKRAREELSNEFLSKLILSTIHEHIAKWKLPTQEEIDLNTVFKYIEQENLRLAVNAVTEKCIRAEIQPRFLKIALAMYMGMLFAEIFQKSGTENNRESVNDIATIFCDYLTISCGLKLQPPDEPSNENSTSDA